MSLVPFSSVSTKQGAMNWKSKGWRQCSPIFKIQTLLKSVGRMNSLAALSSFKAVSVMGKEGRRFSLALLCTRQSQARDFHTQYYPPLMQVQHKVTIAGANRIGTQLHCRNLTNTTTSNYRNCSIRLHPKGSSAILTSILASSLFSHWELKLVDGKQLHKGKPWTQAGGLTYPSCLCCCSFWWIHSQKEYAAEVPLT